MNKHFIKLCLFVVVIFVTSCSAWKDPVLKSAILNPNPEPEVFASHIGDSRERTFCQHTKTALNCVKVVEVHDGDTFFIDLPEAPPPFSERLPVRIAGVDAPELSSKDACEKRKALEAKAILEPLLHNAERIDIINVTRDLYFRIDGVILADGESVGDKLLQSKHAYVYDGNTKSKIDWCNF